MPTSMRGSMGRSHSIIAFFQPYAAFLLTEHPYNHTILTFAINPVHKQMSIKINLNILYWLVIWPIFPCSLFLTNPPNHWPDDKIALVAIFSVLLNIAYLVLFLTSVLIVGNPTILDAQDQDVFGSKVQITAEYTSPVWFFPWSKKYQSQYIRCDIEENIIWIDKAQEKLAEQGTSVALESSFQEFQIKKREAELIKNILGQ